MGRQKVPNKCAIGAGFATHSGPNRAPEVWGERPADYCDSQWKQAIRNLVWGFGTGDHLWPEDKHGPRPGQPGCLMPPHLLRYLEEQTKDKLDREQRDREAQEERLKRQH